PMVPIFFLPGLWVLAQPLGEGLAGIEQRSRAAFVVLGALVVIAPLARLATAAPPGPMARVAALRAAWQEYPVPWSPFRRDPEWEHYGRGVLAVLPPRA